MKNKFKASLKIKCLEFLKDGKSKTTLFNNRKIDFKPEEETNKIDIFLKKKNSLEAREEAIEIIQKLNNLYLFKADSFLIDEEINEENKIIDLDRNKPVSVVSKSLRVKWNIEGREDLEGKEKILKLNFLEKYEKVKEKERLDKLLLIFGDAERVHNKEIKFLCFYKIISEFGKKEHEDVNEWLSKKFELDRNLKRIMKSNGKETKGTRPVLLRHAIMYDEKSGVTEGDLNNMKRYAKKYIKEEFKI